MKSNAQSIKLIYPSADSSYTTSTEDPEMLDCQLSFRAHRPGSELSHKNKNNNKTTRRFGKRNKKRGFERRTSTTETNNIAKDRSLPAIDESMG